MYHKFAATLLTRRTGPLACEPARRHTRRHSGQWCRPVAASAPAACPFFRPPRQEADLGIVADMGTLQRLPSIVGHGVAMDLALTARTFTGAQPSTALHAAGQRRAGCCVPARSIIAQSDRLPWEFGKPCRLASSLLLALHPGAGYPLPGLRSCCIPGRLARRQLPSKRPTCSVLATLLRRCRSQVPAPGQPHVPHPAGADGGGGGAGAQHCCQESAGRGGHQAGAAAPEVRCVLGGMVLSGRCRGAYRLGGRPCGPRCPCLHTAWCVHSSYPPPEGSSTVRHLIPGASWPFCTPAGTTPVCPWAWTMLPPGTLPCCPGLQTSRRCSWHGQRAAARCSAVCEVAAQSGRARLLATGGPQGHSAVLDTPATHAAPAPLSCSSKLGPCVSVTCSSGRPRKEHCRDTACMKGCFCRAGSSKRGCRLG